MDVVSSDILESNNAGGGGMDVDNPSAVQPKGTGVHLEERAMLVEGERPMEQETSAEISEISTDTAGEGQALRLDTAAPSVTEMGPEQEQGTGCCCSAASSPANQQSYGSVLPAITPCMDYAPHTHTVSSKQLCFF
jgi:hypothetical protein